jgi:hypothetical protein
MKKPFIIRFKNKLKGGNKTEFVTIYAETEEKAINTFKANFNMTNTEMIEVKLKGR